MAASASDVRLLIVDDDPQSLRLTAAALEQDGLAIRTATDPAAALELVRGQRPHIVLTDLMMPGLTGIEVLERVMEIDAAIEVVLMTAHYSTDSAVEAIRKGAADYLTKPVEIERLQERVDRLIAEVRERQRAEALDGELVHAHSFEGIIGRSPLMREVFTRIRRVAPHFRTVLITGATGTGKELVARALHRLSPATAGPFAVSNCAAIAEHLVESELFGHVRGSFTGALQDRVGLFEYAHGGVLFLDEIGELQPAAQAKLLRVVENQEVTRVGANTPRKVNVRIVAASNRDLRGAIARKEFREDLFFRLSMVELKLPSLAERREDLPLLMRHFVELFAGQYGKPIEGLTRRAEMVLTRYSWPGNVRELENVIGYAAMLARSARIDVPDLPEHVRGGGAAAQAEAEPAAGAPYPPVSIEEVQRIHARRVLAAAGGDKVRAAEILEVSRATLYRLLAETAKPEAAN